MSVVRYLPPGAIRSVAVIGIGAVGSNWSALFLARGMRVIAYDPSPDAESRARALIKAAWPSLRDLGIATTEQPPLDDLRFVDTAGQAAREADLVQENTPEKPELKACVLAQLDAAASSDKIILSSTGGIRPSLLQAACAHPERFVVVHPFHPSHLIALVEVVGGTQTANAAIEWAMEFSRYLGKRPIRIHAEVDGHLTNRLQFALVREAVACLVEGVSSARDIDDAVRYGLGPRWALMGSLLTLHLAGGASGMRGILDHAGKAIEEWSRPRKPLQLTQDVKGQLIRASEELAQGEAVRTWESWRDRHLVDVLRLQQASAADEPGRRRDA